MTASLIAQLSDPHLRLDDDVTHGALTAAVDRILALRPLPDAVLLTGDIANSGDPAEHALAAELMARLEMPIHRVAGNHDLFRERMRYVAKAGGIRIVVCDTSIEGRDDGALELEWLTERLVEDTTTPTIVAMHHPPIEIGLPWLDELGLPRADRDGLAALLRRSPQVKRVVAGHVHRAITGTVGGVGVVTCASTNIQAALDFETREMALAGEPPSILVHLLLGGEIVTHVQPVESSRGVR